MLKPALWKICRGSHVSQVVGGAASYLCQGAAAYSVVKGKTTLGRSMLAVVALLRARVGVSFRFVMFRYDIVLVVRARSSIQAVIASIRSVAAWFSSSDHHLTGLTAASLGLLALWSRVWAGCCCCCVLHLTHSHVILSSRSGGFFDYLTVIHVDTWDHLSHISLRGLCLKNYTWCSIALHFGHAWRVLHLQVYPMLRRIDKFVYFRLIIQQRSGSRWLFVYLRWLRSRGAALIVRLSCSCHHCWSGSLRKDRLLLGRCVRRSSLNVVVEVEGFSIFGRLLLIRLQLVRVAIWIEGVV